MQELYVPLAVIGGLLLVLGVLGGFLKERTPVSEPLIAPECRGPLRTR